MSARSNSRAEPSCWYPPDAGWKDGSVGILGRLADFFAGAPCLDFRVDVVCGWSIAAVPGHCVGLISVEAVKQHVFGAALGGLESHAEPGKRLGEPPRVMQATSCWPRHCRRSCGSVSSMWSATTLPPRQRRVVGNPQIGTEPDQCGIGHGIDVPLQDGFGAAVPSVKPQQQAQPLR